MAGLPSPVVDRMTPAIPLPALPDVELSVVRGDQGYPVLVIVRPDGEPLPGSYVKAAHRHAGELGYAIRFKVRFADLCRAVSLQAGFQAWIQDEIEGARLTVEHVTQGRELYRAALLRATYGSGERVAA